jgi:hypothetical protein
MQTTPRDLIRFRKSPNADDSVDTIPEALTTNTVGPISIADLARLIECPVEKLQPLVEHKYLRVLFPKQEFERTIVSRPGQRATDWLKMMFQAMKMRPLIPLREVGKLWKVSENHIFKICRHYRIPVQSDPVFGNLISFNGLKSFARARMKYHKPKAYDRTFLLRYFLSQIEGVRWKDPPSYTMKLEMEIRRIATLPYPQRMINAMALIEAFRDARTATECIRREGEIYEELLKSEASVEELRRKVLSGNWRSQARSVGTGQKAEG